MRRVSIWLGIVMIGAALPAAAETLELGNCLRGSLHVKTYNQNDDVCFIPKSDQYITGCGAATLTCVGPCKVEVDQPSAGFACIGASVHSGEKIYTTAGILHDADRIFELDIDNFLKNCDCGESEMRQALGR